MRKELEQIHVYSAVHLKLTQHCESTIVQYKIKILKTRWLAQAIVSILDASVLIYQVKSSISLPQLSCPASVVCSLWYTVGSYWLSILRIAVYTCRSHRILHTWSYSQVFNPFSVYFVYGVMEYFNFILLHVPVQFSQHHLLKRLSFLHCVILPTLKQINTWF